MRILVIGPRLYLGDIHLSMMREGHEVRVHAEDAANMAFAGLLDSVPDWRAELDWVGRDGLILFERIGRGAVQDELRRDGYRVVGGSAFGDRLEHERAFGQAVLREAGMLVAEAPSFPDATAARAWLRANPGRYVLKHDAVGRTTFVGEHPDGLDVDFMLRRTERLPVPEDGARVLLMERLEGVEVGIGAYFDGQRFLRPACIDFEHKRFFDGERGEMTGEMGTLASYEGSERLFEATLGRVAGRLREAGHVGYVNLNLIVNERGVWPLEFTCRIGNPGFAVLAALQPDGWADLFGRMASGGYEAFRTLPGWSVCIVLTMPPFPAHFAACAPEEDAPVFFLDGASWDAPGFHPVDVRMEDGQLLAMRRSGNPLIVTGVGETVEAARDAAMRRAEQVVIPEIRWRRDIGERFLARDAALLRAWGWWG
jgi:phosphoribosylamine--glycine ligase